MARLSPFPGMDPFLEDPIGWNGVHTRLIASLSDYLVNVLSPHFIVNIEARVYITNELDDKFKKMIVPDLYAIEGRPLGAPTAPRTAVAIMEPTLIEPLPEEIIYDRYLEIRDAQQRDVVTTLELLSPFNKAPGSEGRRAFLDKRRLVISSKVHWIEIDLLREGKRPPEVADKSDYYALLKRGRGRPYEVWYFDLRDRLPVIAVPLRPPFADVPLDLQAVFNDMYTRAHYAESIDYTDSVPPPDLRPADAAWVQAQIQTWSAEVVS
ncbi:MAG: DUF4058 family protein [Chloroflexota bacterium]